MPLAGLHAAVGLTHAIARRFMQPSGSLMPLTGIYKHALAGISILSLVRYSSSHLDAGQVQPIFTRPGIGHPRIFSHNPVTRCARAPCGGVLQVLLIINQVLRFKRSEQSALRCLSVCH
ncbi:hypothetical protein ILYODFUR_024738 [Ilyodon furcidens]|uniref:Uncharacterized protein n=1 Tax=Ilyodon furcidens TaxID=33524 RepID=A0ABV0V9A5_9TELE